MDISLKSEEYKSLVINKENSLEENLEAEFSLPEYMSEILRIIKTTAEPKVISCKLVDNKITLDCICEIRMIYTSEDGCVYSVSQQKQFTRQCEKEELAEALDVNGAVSVNYVNCRATGTKKAEVKVGLQIKFVVYYEEKISFINFEKCNGVEQKNCLINAFSLGCKKTRYFSMSDTINLVTPASFIVGQRACAVLSEVRKISNKIMLRGETVVELEYVNSDNKAIVERCIHSIPLNQIIEVDGFDESFKGTVTLQVNAVDVILKGEQGNFVTALDVSVGINASVLMWEEKQCSLVCDAYGIDGEVALSKKQVPFCIGLEEVGETFVFDDSFSVSGEGVASVLSETIDVKNVSSSYVNGELCVTGSLCVAFIIRDNTDSVINVNKVFDFSFKKSMQTNGEISFEPVIDAVSLKTNVNKSNEIAIRAEMRVCGVVVSEKVMEIVVDVATVETEQKPQRLPITIYYPEHENESLWDIACHYKTTVSAIVDENSLEGDTTGKARVLFIPSA